MRHGNHNVNKHMIHAEEFEMNNKDKLRSIQNVTFVNGKKTKKPGKRN